VRGLSSDFTRTRINGMEAQATTGATDSSGGTNRGRGFDFNVFASELFNNITVRKTASAETEEGSLGATVDLRTSRPFDYPGFTAGGSLQYGYNDMSEAWAPRAAFLVSNTWMDGQFGALLSVAYSERSLYEEGFSSVRWGPASGDSGFANPEALPGGATNAANLFHPRIPRYGRLVHEQERTGATLSLQARPGNGATTFTYDALYSHLNATRQENFLEAWSLSRNASQGGKPEVVIVDAIADGAELVYLELDNMDMRTEQRFDRPSTEFIQHTFTLEHEFSDDFRMRFLIGRAESEFENAEQTTVIIDRQNTDGYSIDFRGNRNLPLIDYGFDVTDPNAWTVVGPTGANPRSEIRMNPNGQTNVYNTAQLDFVHEINPTFTLKTGLNYKESQFEGWGLVRAAANDAMPELPAGVSMADLTTLLTGFGGNLDLPAGNATSWIVPDLQAFAELFNIYCNCDTGVPGGDFRLTGLTNSRAVGNFRQVTEEARGAYVQLDWDSFVGSMPFRGNIGVRHVRTSVEAAGYSTSTGATPVTGENSYEDTLPSLNISIEPVQDLVVRFGAAQVMSRPPVTSLVPVFNLSADGAPNPSASLGNVNLEPYRADTFDLSVEWYFAPESLLSFAFFYKDISSFVQTTQQTLTYAELTALNPTAFPVGARPAGLEHVFSTPTNTPGGPLSGFEISYQQPFYFLPGVFQNLGGIVNYTFVASEIDYCQTSSCAAFATEDLVNLSPQAWNATLYYDDGRFNARVSAAYRDGYFQQIPAANAGGLGIVANGKSETLTFDASASYEVTDNVILTFEGLNLTDEPNRQWHGEVGGDRQSTAVYHQTGRQFYAGVRYRF
ncbi:MAG: TonB-dependent receptor, partial [Brevundimonas sp.]